MHGKKLIVPVCRGNIARSAVAEVLIRNLIEEHGLESEYETISRGVQGTRVDPGRVTYPNITYYKHISLYSDSKPWLDENNLDLSEHVSKPIDKDIAQRASVMLAMDNRTLQGLQELFPDQVSKIHLLKELIGESGEIVDPVNVSGIDKQAKIFSDIQNTLVEGFSKMISLADRAVEGEINKEGNQNINSMQERK